MSTALTEAVLFLTCCSALCPILLNRKETPQNNQGLFSASQGYLLALLMLSYLAFKLIFLANLISQNVLNATYLSIQDIQKRVTLIFHCGH